MEKRTKTVVTPVKRRAVRPSKKAKKDRDVKAIEELGNTMHYNEHKSPTQNPMIAPEVMMERMFQKSVELFIIRDGDGKTFYFTFDDNRSKEGKKITLTKHEGDGTMVVIAKNVKRGKAIEIAWKVAFGVPLKKKEKNGKKK